MCSHGMFCGTGSFRRMATDGDGDDQPCKTPPGASSPSSSPKGGSKKKAGKNPYAGRGLDKLSSVMSELEARREQIMASAGPQGVAMVRFMHSNSRDWVPIVVRLRDHPTKGKQDHPLIKMRAEAPKEARGATPQASASASKVVKKSFSWGCGDYNNNNNNNKNSKEGEGERWSWRRGYNWVVVMVIILACLMVFGRVFAICCTSISWYLAPTLKGEGEEGHNRRSTKKKDYGRRISANKAINI